MRSSVGLVIVLVAAGCTAPASSPAGSWVDLTHAFGEDTLYWPTATPFALEVVADGETPGGYYYAANRFAAAEHGGTHVDAPIHFYRPGGTVDRIPVERLIGPGAVVDVAEQVAADPDYRVTVGDLQAWEAAHGRIPDGAIVLLRTGFAERWPDPAAYLGTAERGEAAVADLHFPGLHPDAALWLAGERDVGAVGIDTASIDHGPSTAFHSHRILFAKKIPALENVGSMAALPPRGATIVALPMKIRGGSGAPLRIVALLPAP